MDAEFDLGLRQFDNQAESLDACCHGLPRQLQQPSPALRALCPHGGYK
jgi:hypothetical protein